MCTSENKGPAFGVRMKPSLKRYVEQWPGKNFSDKLEAMISFYQEHEREQRQKLATLDRSIQQRRAKLEAVSKRALEMRTLETQQLAGSRGCKRYIACLSSPGSAT